MGERRERPSTANLFPEAQESLPPRLAMCRVCKRETVHVRPSADLEKNVCDPCWLNTTPPGWEVERPKKYLGPLG